MKDEERELLIGVAKALLEMPGPPSYYVHRAFAKPTLFEEQETWTEGHAELKQLIDRIETRG